jgi:hypothetical protein
LNVEEIILIALTAAATFWILIFLLWVWLLDLALVSVLALTWLDSLADFKASGDSLKRLGEAKCDSTK